jgi:predicted permease
VRLARARGPRAALGLWTRVARDAGSTALAVRRRPRDAQPARAGGFDMLWQDVRFALRHLLRAPIFSLGAIALLAVGLGANVAVFSVVDRLLIRRPAFDQPDRVVHIYQDSDDGEPSSNAFPAYRDMAAVDVFSAVAASSPDTMTWDRADAALDVRIEFTTSSYLDVAGRSVQRGRWFSREHDVVGAEPVAVVSAAAWRSRFDRDPDVVGRSIRLQGSPVTIIGVGPDGLDGSLAPVVTDFWLSISSTPIAGAFRASNLERREDHWYDVMARLAPGVSPDQAQAAMTALAGRLGQMYPDLDRGRGITVRRALDVRLYEDSRRALTTTSVIVAALLLLSCANLANLLLVRGLGRTGEMAIRRALGAGSLRVARLHLIEALLLSAAGGAGGLALAHLALSLVPLAPLPLAAGMELSIDARIVVFAAALVAVVALVFGLVPAWRSARNLSISLREDRRTSSMSRSTARLQHALVVVQVAGSLLFVLAAGLLGRSLLAMQRVDTGVDAERLAYVRTSTGQAAPDGGAAAVTLEQVRARVAALPGVTHAALASRLPAQSAGTTTTIVEDYTPPAGTGAVELSFTAVSPEYFDATGLGIIAGRGFTAADVAGADRVVVVNRAAAERFWGIERAVGRKLRSQGQPDAFRTVVGVTRDAPVNGYPEVPVRPMFLVPTGQAILGSAFVIARTEGAPEGLIGAMRSAVTSVRSTLPITSQGTFTELFGDALRVERFTVGVMGTMSLLALLLASMGIYAVVAFNVARRTGEMGIRVALGADPRRVVRLVVGETFAPVAVGLAVGLLVAAPAAGQVEALLYGVRPRDPLTFGAAIGCLAAVSCFAAWVPARRASKADPVRALRTS